MRHKKIKLRAFSFLESIISVFILSFGIVAVLPLVTSSLNDSHDSRDQMIAAFLAQEGVELVYNIRDNNWAAGDYAFEANFPDQDNSNPDCRVSYDSISIGNDDCDSGLDKKLYLNNTSHFYTHDPDDASGTKFQRKISINYMDSSGVPTNRNNAAQAKVTSTTIWGENFPDPLDPDLSKRGCNTKNKCSEVSVTLTTWH